MPLERIFSLGDLSRLEIELRRGNVTIDTDATNQVLLRAEFLDGASESDLRVERIDEILRISQPLGSGLFNGRNPFDLNLNFNFDFRARNWLDELGLGPLLGQLGRIDLRLSVPPSFRNLAVTTALGTVQLARWAESAMVRTGKGDVALGSGSGRAEVTAGMGAVRIARFTGRCSVNAGVGDVTIADGEGEAHLQTGMGKVYVSNATLTLEANSGVGDVRLEGVGGTAKLRSGVGAVNVSGARDLTLDVQAGKGDLHLAGRFPSIRARTGLGEIFYQLDWLGSAADLNTARGAINLDLATEQTIRIDAATSRGQIDSAVPLVQVGQPGPESFFGRRVVGTTGGGEIQATVRLRTGIGDIRVARAGASLAAVGVRASASPVPPPSFSEPGRSAPTGPVPGEPPISPPPAAPPAAPEAATPLGPESAAVPAPEVASPPEPAPAPATAPADAGEQARLGILQALSRGEISVEEAERRLLALS
jgi:hypothetical protein